MIVATDGLERWSLQSVFGIRRELYLFSWVQYKEEVRDGEPKSEEIYGEQASVSEKSPHVYRENGLRSIWYEDDFRQFLKEHRHSPRQIIQLTDSIIEKGRELCEGDICVRCIDVNQEDGERYSISFQVTIDEKMFFLKKEEHDPDEGGFAEMQDTLLAKDVIDESQLSGVRVATPLMGYTDQRMRNYYVAEWLSLPLLDDVIDEYLKKGQQDEARLLLEKIESIRELLTDYHELGPSNMFYDRARNEIVIFDLHL